MRAGRCASAHAFCQAGASVLRSHPAPMSIALWAAAVPMLGAGWPLAEVALSALSGWRYQGATPRPLRPPPPARFPAHTGRWGVSMSSALSPSSGCSSEVLAVWTLASGCTWSTLTCGCAWVSRSRVSLQQEGRQGFHPLSNLMLATTDAQCSQTSTNRGLQSGQSLLSFF